MTAAFFLFTASAAQAHEDQHADFEIGEAISESEFLQPDKTCQVATRSEIAEVEKGNKLRQEFLRKCDRETDGSPWCSQLARPNPDSLSIFRCTYGKNLPHQLIHPARNTWKYAYKAVELVEDLEDLGICVRQIYNWWRPAPYNGNVGGAAGRHPYATSVDVRMCSLADMEKAFTQLCKYRAKGRLRAIGYYGSTGLHFGIGDRNANTWGKSCPSN